LPADSFNSQGKPVSRKDAKTQRTAAFGFLSGFAPLRDPILAEQIRKQNRIAIDRVLLLEIHQDLSTAKENRSRAKSQRRKEQPLSVFLAALRLCAIQFVLNGYLGRIESQ
jgi:hypothetical protein